MGATTDVEVEDVAVARVVVGVRSVAAASTRAGTVFTATTLTSVDAPMKPSGGGVYQIVSVTIVVVVVTTGPRPLFLPM